MIATNDMGAVSDFVPTAQQQEILAVLAEADPNPMGEEAITLAIMRRGKVHLLSMQDICTAVLYLRDQEGKDAVVYLLGTLAGDKQDGRCVALGALFFKHPPDAAFVHIECLKAALES